MSPRRKDYFIGKVVPLLLIAALVVIVLTIVTSKGTHH